MEVKLIVTNDGSSSLFVPSIDESYHSRHGALTESVHVFIKNGLYERLSFEDLSTVNVLEVGFGTGLNAMLAMIASLNKNFQLRYVGLEPAPLPKELASQLNYSEILSHPAAKELFSWLHETEWNTEHSKSQATIKKVTSGIESFESKEKFDVVFFDAFAPEKQPELWTPFIYKKLFSLMNDAGILTTYCAKGQVKRDLLNCGFMVESLKGPPGKREMVRATKPPQNSKTDSDVTQ